ncbi:MAG: hypothetical protein M3R15_19490 [Acidobacteriota bacterium]|nr:hypothetical protein [Acidobacteriota bacterium]
MMTTAQEIYAQAVRQLPTQEQLRLATLILEEITSQQRTPLAGEERKKALAELMQHAGAVSSGNPRSADNEQIDLDLARAYNNDAAED